MPTPFMLILLLMLAPITAFAVDTSGPERTAPASAQASHPSPQDRSFIEQFLIAGLAEIELAELALKKTTNPQVSTLAGKLLSDSKAACARLRTLTRPLMLAPLPDAPDADHRTLFEQLSAASPQDFDLLYADSQLRDHEDQVSVLEMQVSSGDSAELKKFAADVLPTVREHLQLSRQLSEFMKAQR